MSSNDIVTAIFGTVFIVYIVTICIIEDLRKD